MLTQLDAREAILKQYADGPSLLDSALAGLSETDLDLALSDDSWTIRQIVHHIVDGDDLWKTCIKMALGNSDALFSLQWYTVRTQREWSESWAYSRRGIESSLALYRANRRHMVELLENFPGACERSIRFERPGKEEIHITVFDVVELHVDHLTEHIESIQAIRKAHVV
jgi:hypothetical protein